MNWNNVVSMVATSEGLLVTERDESGQVGAAPMTRLLPGMPTGVRNTPTLGSKTGYALVATPVYSGKKLTKPGGEFQAKYPPGMLLFDSTETDALNWAQSMNTPGFCWTLHKLVQVRQTNAGFDFVREVNDVMKGVQSEAFQKVIVWTSCPYSHSGTG